MTIKSSHNYLEWRTQFDRTRRWYARLKKIEHEIKKTGLTQDSEDYIYAFFQNCWHLREWLSKSKVVEKNKIEQLVASHEELRLCRDICNGTKHMSITRPSVDSGFYTFREYDWLDQQVHSQGPRSNQKFMVRAAGRKHNMFALAHRCMKIWDDFVDRHVSQPKREPNQITTDNSEASPLSI